MPTTFNIPNKCEQCGEFPCECESTHEQELDAIEETLINNFENE